MKRFFNITKAKIRIIYWLAVLLLMVFIVCPIFFFFYLFDEGQVKQILYEQFDNYHLEVGGKIQPRWWHGLSFEVNNLYLSTNKDVELFKVKTALCQLSWLDLVTAHYKIRRMDLNNVDIHEENIIKHNLGSIINFSHLDKSSFSRLKNLNVFEINSIDKNAPYPITDGLLKIEQNNSSTTFKMDFKLSDYDTTFIFQGVANAVHNDVIKFSDFTTQIYNDTTRISLTANTSYSIPIQQLSLQNVMGDIIVNGYSGKINASTINLSSSVADVQKVSMWLNLNNSSANQKININLDNIMFLQYKTFDINQIDINYLAEIDSNQLSLASKLNQVKINNKAITSKACNNILKYSSPNLNNNNFGATLSGMCEYIIPKHQLNMKMNGLINMAPLKLLLKVITSEEKPKITLSGEIDNLDLSSLGVNKDKLKPLYYDTTKLPFNWLSLFNMDGNLSIKHFMLNQIHLNDLNTQFRLNESTLNINKLCATVYDGHLSAQARIAKVESGYNISTTQTIEHLDLKTIFKDLFDVEAISGKADFKIDAKTKNVNLYDDLHKHLNGTITIEANNGAFQGVDFNIFTSPKLGIGTNKSTVFNKLRANFIFNNGISQSGSVNFTSPDINANGSGTVDCVNTKIDYILTIKSALPPNEQKISSVVIPVLAKGDLFNPKINIQNIHLFTRKSEVNAHQKAKIKNSKAKKPYKHHQF